MNAVNIQSLARAWQAGMCSNFVSWAPPSVLISWTEPCLMIFPHLSLAGCELSSRSCCATGAQHGGKHGAWEQSGKEGASGHC